MAQLFSNNAITLLAADITNVATTVTVTTGEGALFESPTGGDFELITITNGTDIEIMQVTTRSSDSFTVVRGQEGTSGTAFTAGAVIEARNTAGTMDLLRDTIATNTAGLAAQIAEENLFRHAMTKAEFFARMESNRDKYAGSGFVEFGRSNSTVDQVNQGLWPFPAIANQVYMGRSLTSGSVQGVSRTGAPLANINGVLCSIENVASSADSQNLIKFPDAPTANQLVTNGTFDTDTTGWTERTDGISQSGGELLITNGTSTQGSAEQEVTGLVVGQTYLFEFEYTGGTATGATYRLGTSTGNGDIFSVIGDTTTGIKRFEWVATFTSVFIGLRTNSATTGETATFDNVSLIDKADLSRQDLAFLESWHEKVTDKDWVAPYGSVQSGLTTYDGITLTNSVGNPAAGYSAFGEWEASPTVGYGVVYSTMTDADKQKFIGNPLNNCYLDDDGSVVQVRYRVRTIAGLGDGWDTIVADDSSLFLRYGDSGTSNVKPQGSSTTSVGLGAGYRAFAGFGLESSLTDVGTFRAVSASGTPDTAVAVDGLCFATPIALVQRRNQGAYHNVFNENGCAEFGDSLPFYSTTDTVSSTNDCFISVGDGSISGAASGRPDGLFYDAIYASDVIKDLRFPADKVADQKRTLDREFNKWVNGELRGLEGQSFTSSDGATVTETTGDHSAETLLFCNIIGSASVLNAWLGAESVFGSNIDEDGNNYVPDGIIDDFKLSRNASAAPALALRSTDNGATWATFTPTFSTTTNTVTLTNEPAANIVLIFYTTKANPTVLAANAEALVIGAALAANAAGYAYVVSSLIGKVATGTTNGLPEVRAVEGYSLDSGGLLSTDVDYQPAHADVSTKLDTGSPAAKVLRYLTRRNGRGYVGLLYKQMIYDVDWGDNSQFTVLDSESTETDDNGNTIIIGTREIPLNIFISDEE